MKNPKCTPEEQKKIEALANKGIPDTQIAKKLNLPINTVQVKTTRYWKNKMDNKHEG